MMNIIEEAGSLVSLVDYQDGSVVSKEIIKKDKGTVTLFAFDKGQGLSEHTAPFDALVYIFERILRKAKQKNIRCDKKISGFNKRFDKNGK